MAQIKLLFPTLTNAGTLFQLVAPHSALLSLALPEDQNQEAADPHPNFQPSPSPPLPWTPLRSPNASPLLLEEEHQKSLRFAMEDDNDYQEGERGTDFAHVLQLEEEYDLNDLETVKSECLSGRERTLSEFSEVESLSEDPSVVVSLV